MIVTHLHHSVGMYVGKAEVYTYPSYILRLSALLAPLGYFILITFVRLLSALIGPSSKSLGRNILSCIYIWEVESMDPV